MSQHSRDFLLDRICSGKIALYLDDEIYFYHHPSFGMKYEGNLLEQRLIESNSKNLLTRLDMLFFLKEMGKWKDVYEDEINIHIPKVIDIIKVDIYHSFKLDPNLATPHFEKLSKVKERLKELLAIKYMFDDYTIENLANKEKYLFYLSNRVRPKTCPNKLLSPFLASYLEESDIRWLARHGSWSIKWNALKKGMNIFSKYLTEEQEQLIRWSTIYENIHESQDCPNNIIIENDDAFDGYLISRQKDSERQQGLDEIDSKLSDRAKNASEVYIPARSKEHARELNALNTPDAIRAKERKFKQIIEEKIVKNSDLTDERIKLDIAKNILASRS